jgi:hypothetical protein
MVISICRLYVYETFYESSILYEDGLWGLGIALKEIDKIQDRFFLRND